MKHFFAALMIVLGLSLTLPAHAAGSAVVGQKAPNFTATDSKGLTRTLSEYQGQIVVLEWTNAECPYVQKHYKTGNMQALQQDAVADGVTWFTVLSSAPGMQGYLDSAGANAQIAADDSHETARLMDPSGDLGRLYGAVTSPHMFVIDKSGTLVYAGAIDDIPSADHDTVKSAKNYVRAALADLDAGRPVTDAVTKPYGCSVKYK